MQCNSKPLLTFIALCITLVHFTFAQSPGGVRTSLRLWLKANDGPGSTTNNTAISQWNDKSGGARHATQGTAGNQPVYNNNATNNINFNPVIDFTNTSYHNMSFSTSNPILSNGSGDFSVYIVCRYETAGGVTIVGHGSSVNNESMNAGMESSGVARFHTYNDAWSPSASALVAGATVLATYGHNSGTRKLIVDGTSMGTDPVAFNLTSTYSRLGANHTSATSSNFNGQLAEVIIYQALGSEQSRVESYLAMKYGITKSGSYLSSNSTTVWNAITNSSYHNNVAAIGRDDASGLSQLQSRSIKTGVQPVIGNASTITSLNTSHTDTFSADQSFLVWGSDNGSTSFATSYALGTRMARTWKVQETGTVGTVKVGLRQSEIGTVNGLNLVVSSDATFGSGDAQYSMTTETIGTDVYYTATVDLSNGQYFTFGHCSSPTLSVTPSSGDYVWKGTNSSSWSDAGNWYYYSSSTYTNAASVPGSTSNIFIPSNQCASSTSPMYHQVT